MDGLTIQLHRLSLALPRLCVFPQLGDDEVVANFVDMLGTGNDDAGAVRFYRCFSAFVQRLRGRNWPEYLVEGLARCRPERYGMTWQELASSSWLKRDLRIVQQAASVDAAGLKGWAAERWPELKGGGQGVFAEYLSLAEWPCWQAENTGGGFCASWVEVPGAAAQWMYRRQREFGSSFWREADWADNAPLLCDHMSRLGSGVFHGSVALRWDDKRGLMPVERPDAVTLDGLFCQEREQKIVRENTERFLQGRPAWDVIVYGSRGTGKSSLVKALLNTYARQGLRLIQVQKKQLSALPEIGRLIADAPLKFIIFIDDLSFDERESAYKELKSLLEGGVESRPHNMLIYATSNRRHLMPETFAERQDEVHGRDVVEEKLSLSDRFGLTVTFLSPDQESYLTIVRGLAEQAGLTDHMTNAQAEISQLEEQALKWALMHNGRSGRTARQFIDSLLQTRG